MKAGCGREIKRSPRRYEHNGEKACMLPGRGKQKGETHPVLELRKEEMGSGAVTVIRGREGCDNRSG